jgi:hypothetical protein
MQGHLLDELTVPIFFHPFSLGLMFDTFPANAIDPANVRVTKTCISISQNVTVSAKLKIYAVPFNFTFFEDTGLVLSCLVFVKGGPISSFPSFFLQALLQVRTPYAIPRGWRVSGRVPTLGCCQEFSLSSWQYCRGSLFLPIGGVDLH